MDLTKDYYRTGEAARLVGVSSETLKQYADMNRVESSRNEVGHRLFTLEQLSVLKPELFPQKIAFYCCGESFSDQERVLLNNFGDPDYIFLDKDLDDATGMAKLINVATEKTLKTVYVTNPDIMPVGVFLLLQAMLKAYNTQLKIIER